MPRRTRAKDLRRKVETRRERRTVVIFCEGKKSEPDYLQGVKRLPEVRRVHRLLEVRVILHHQHHTAALSTAQAENLRGTLDGRPGKQVDPDRYLPNRRLAAQRASALAERHVRNGTSFPNDNPSSTFGDLLAAIEP